MHGIYRPDEICALCGKAYSKHDYDQMSRADQNGWVEQGRKPITAFPSDWPVYVPGSHEWTAGRRRSLHLFLKLYGLSVHEVHKQAIARLFLPPGQMYIYYDPSVSPILYHHCLFFLNITQFLIIKNICTTCASDLLLQYIEAS
jgi:hypothetical protein